MNLFKDIKNIAILVLIAVIVVSQIKGCDGDGGGQDTVTVTKTEIKEIPVRVEVPKYVPKYVKEIQTQEVLVSTPIDTTQILAKYFKRFEYTDTLRIPYTKDFPDSLKLPNRKNDLGFVIVKDEVTKNEIFARSLIWDYSTPLVKVTTTHYIKEKPRTQVYYGFGTGFNQVNFIDNVYGGVIVKTKKDKIYSANIGVSSTGSGTTPFVGGGIYWKIQLRKPKVTDLIK